MAHITLYHNPRCSKSRAALALLQNTEHTLTIIDYLQTGITFDQLQQLFDLLNIPAHDLIRANETAYKNLQLSEGINIKQILAAIVEQPILLQRPIVVVDDKQAIIARPTERLEELLTHV